MTILAFALDPRLRTRFNVLIVNLAAADLLYCTILQPISVDSYLHLRWRSGQLWCSIFGLLLFLSNSVSIITLCLVAVGRYLLVAKRAVFERVFSDRGLIILLISAWALGLGSFAPLWSVYVRVRIASQALLRYRFSRRSSRKKPASSAQGTDDSGVNTCSCEISSQADLTQNTEVITSERSSQSTQDPVSNSSADVAPTKPPSSTPAPTPAGPSSHSSATSGDDGEFKRVTRMCFTVFLCFVFCFVPFLLLNIADKKNRAPQVLHMFSANLTWLNSCINPVLYAVMNRQFRQAYHVLLTRAAAPFTSLCTRLGNNN
ncbi:G-protein coupled receptor 84 Inflammation-related G-protein coupled receptor EX33 [Larimichthys crocea]|uniref:G-protein coupled receptor 84 Inflammation-related G-protein coupled receptor EX33 n=1 Tax=Larimichthys crocea TaxID=215358 RepID=A0A6G0J4X7_LARCR|nr:G-protein coupled receptor 84 Inflammation-related G-protein coupled receptor EX33 [Larimichthys crocea]